MTMKIIILVVINLVTTISSETTNVILNSLRTSVYKFQSIYLQKCAKNLDLTEQKEFKIDLDVFRFQMVSALEVKHLCSNYDVSYLQEFAKGAKGCLDTNEKYLPDLIINAEKRIWDKFCKGNGFDHLMKIANDKCNLFLDEDRISDFVGTCLLKLNIIQNLDKTDYSLNRIDVCSDLKTSQKCIISTFQTNCEIAKEHIDFLNSIFEEYQKECSLANTNMSNFVLLATLVIISKLSQ